MAQEMLADERRDLIYRYLEQGHRKVTELSALLNVSKVTIRRDLAELESEGLVRKTHGGAVALRGTRYEPDFAARTGEHSLEKRAVARLAAGMVHDGDSIAIDAGTSTFELALHLTGKKISVVTTSLAIATELLKRGHRDVHLVGGQIRFPELSLVGYIAEDVMSKFFVDKSFIATAGLSMSGGITDHDASDVGVKRKMIDQSRERILLADHGKFERKGFFVVCPVQHIHTVVTDDQTDLRYCEDLKRMGINVLLASTKEG